MENSSINIKICPYVKKLLSIQRNLTSGIHALTQLRDTYGDDGCEEFIADDFLETRDTLLRFKAYVSEEIVRLVENRMNLAEKDNQR